MSVATIRVALNQAGFQVRRARLASHKDEGRTLLDDLYGDPKIVKALTGHGVVVPEKASPTGTFESLAPLPLPMGLVTELYEGVGLPILHMSLLLGVARRRVVRAGLKSAGMALRPKGPGRTLNDTAWIWRNAPEFEGHPGDQGLQGSEAPRSNPRVIES